MTPRPHATVSIDLDDLWAYRRSFGLPAQGPSLLPLALPRFMALMAARRLAATTFIVGSDAARPELAPLWAQLSAAGHEPGNHSWEHAGDIEAWPAERQRVDLQRAHEAISAATGVAPVGFRAPSFRISAPLLQTVRALGYRYDSSTFPNALAGLARRWQQQRARRLGRHIELPADAHGAAARLPLHAYAWQWPAQAGAGELLELPITTLPGLRLPLHGTYLQHLADFSAPAARAYAALAFRLCRLAGVTPHLLLHATDFIGADDGLDVAFLPGMRRPWREKQALLQQALDALQRHFEPVTMARSAALLSAQTTLPRRAAVPGLA